MAQPGQTFPNPGTKPGEYALEWLVGKRRFSGDVALAPRRRPQIDLNGALKRRKRSSDGVLEYELPGNETPFPRLVGQLRSSEQVVVIDAVLVEWFPERFQGFGRWAIVGLELAGVPDDRYEHVSFQISDADLWFGAPPLSDITWPKRGSVEKKFSATLNSAAHRVWRDTVNGVTFDVGYPHTFSLDPYQFGLTFAPVFDVRSRDPLSLDQWRDEWLAPLVDLASIATKRPQTLSWLNVHTGEGRSAKRGRVFTGGIDQSPYAAHYDNEWRRDAHRRPLFTLAQLSATPMKLVRTWRRLQASDDPFVELYRAALFQPDLPPRARFLHLIQALEARHSFANRDADKRSQTSFQTRRAEVISAAQATGLPAADFRFLKDEWSKQKRDSLERRLRPLLKDLPTDVRQRLESDPALDPIREPLRTDVEAPATTTEAQLRVLRNQLSHGDRNYPDHDLRPWVALVETVCRAQLLGALGFRTPEIATALSRP